jgi:hypothetical protein
MSDYDLGLSNEGGEAGDIEDAQLLKRVWRNEKCAPVLLPYEEVRCSANRHMERVLHALTSAP